MLLLVCAISGGAYVWMQQQLQHHNEALREEITRQKPVDSTRDIISLRSEMRALQLQLEAFKKMPLAAPSSELALEQLSADVSNLSTTLDALSDRVQTLEKAPLAITIEPTPPAAWLAFVNAVRSGKPFDTALAALEKSSPKYQLPESLRAHAASGIGTRSTLKSQLVAAINTVQRAQEKPQISGFLSRYVQVESASAASLNALADHANHGNLIAASSAIDALENCPKPLREWNINYRQYLRALREVRALEQPSKPATP
jgi:hypothetical protein